jgi:two-component system KDP operon response regulator KdpE
LLTAINAPEEILKGFESGADDVILKPFDSRILLAKTKALLRRCKKIKSAPEIIECGNLSINQTSREVVVNGNTVYLTETEYNLLLELAKHHDQVMLHEQLLESVWGPEYRHEMDYLRSYVHILRKKLELKPSSPSLIVSLSGIGYKLVTTPAEKKGE